MAKPPNTESYFHLHLVSDSTGETLLAVGRAAAAQFATVSPVEHVFPLLRNERQLDHALDEIEANPGIVLYTLVDHALGEKLEARCRELNVPCLSVLGPVLSLFHSYLGAETTPRIGGQHMMNPAYFRRIDALNFTMMHDDGQHTEDLEDADVVLIGVSRTSKTPTSIYLANRGIKTLNIPLVPEIEPPAELETAKRPLVVGLFASPERIVQIRQNRLLSLNAAQSDSAYIDRERVSQEIAASKKLCAKHGWPSIDVSRRSIEETAAAVIALLQERRRTEQA
ncbi:MAG TPA: pyruvate, water dikinase regulatory protein [Xanthobacteraceae bacterium]|nr:pyruvate, water dikinase regulatory protein [Xanthobacteraceae bacterium]